MQQTLVVPQRQRLRLVSWPSCSSVLTSCSRYNDGVYGGVGDDGELVGGGGTDDISGGWGDDLIRSRDGVEDFVSCGPNEDTAFVDPEDKVAPGCEHVNPI